MKSLRILLLLAVIPWVATAQPSQPKNVIFIVGDGMGTAQVYSSIVAQGEGSAFLQFPVTGFSRTYSYDKYTTDSGAGGTALMTGHKVENKHIAFGPNREWYSSFLTKAKCKQGRKVGFVVTSSVLDATPASTYAHVSNRKHFDSISNQMAKCGFDVMIGGDKNHFLPANREDGLTPIVTMQEAGYQMIYDVKELDTARGPLLCGLLSEDNPAPAPQRGDMLLRGVKCALRNMENEKGFVLMIEGSQIDWACHDNDTVCLAAEMADFETVLHYVLDYARRDGNTLVVVTADHETGGLTLFKGDISKRSNQYHFATGNHSGVMVPVFAYGPGAEQFSGIQQNTAIARKIMKLLGLGD